jgi:DNA-binding SARP family transcriptional activator
MPVLRLDLLGDYQIHAEDGTLVAFSAKKSQALMAYLAVKPSQRVSRDKMASILWSSTGPEQARQSLRQLLSTMRRELTQISPDQKLLIEEADFLGVDGSAVVADVAEFETLLAAGTEESLTKAIALYRGDFLDGFTITEEKFDQWVLGERDRLHRAAIRAHSYLLELQSKHDSIDEATATAQSALRIDPLQEAMHRTLMRLYVQSGDLAAALQQFDTCARALKRELGVEPDAETRALQQQISQMRQKRTTQPKAERAPEDEPKTILVVEDNLLNRELTNAVLKAAGYNVVIAIDGAEALMAVARDRIDLMLLDIDLPFIDGHSVLQALKEKGVNVPAIFISGLPGDEPEIRAFEIGAADFIHKPVKNNVLLARVRRVLGGE